VQARSSAALALLVCLLFASSAQATCLDCHGEHIPAAGDPHAFLADNCSACHRGQADADTLSEAHRGLVVSPGQFADVSETCGRCHADHTDSVSRSLMRTGRGMVNVTRFTFGEQQAPDGHGDLALLGDSPADSLLRKLCASCHLGQPLHQIETVQPIGRRGGGCLACHLPHAWGAGHPALTARVEDSRCVGCHSRSARVALNYAGLGEVDDALLHQAGQRRLGRLEDGRLVEHLPSDVHHRAGLGCIDCHTVRDLMGPTDAHLHGSDAVDIQCRDCHANDRPPLLLKDWPDELLSLRSRIPFAADDDQPFLVTGRRGTPLWHIEMGADGLRLHRKLAGGTVAIPPLSDRHHPSPGPHDRISCSACHSQWAPQCYGCHVSYDSSGEQWDHLERAITPGAWHESRWDVRNERPPLGVDAHGNIRPFIPGMIRTVEHPEWDAPRFRRLFAPVSPHTTGPAPDCEACHRSPVALGLGEGSVVQRDGSWHFTPAHPLLEDGMAKDSFVTLEGRQAETTRLGARGFLPEELQRILDAPLTDSALTPGPGEDASSGM
jgi:predicted CXXCH cytochrome family protein